MNWFLYIITEDFIDEDGKKVRAGDAGVGRCSMSAGISDAYKGIMYVVPGEYVENKIKKSEMIYNPSAATMRKIIEDYYKESEIIEISLNDIDFFLD